MKLLFLIFLFPSIVFSQNDYIQQVQKHRDNKNKEFKDSLKSPIRKDKIADFDSLNYFPINSNYKVEAKFVKDIGKPFDMATSNGKMKRFRQYGVLYFKLNNENYELPIYQNIQLMTHPIYRNHIFIPFTDLTNNRETYGGGRYIDATIPTSDTMILDFNYSYNPSCHYSAGFSCPVPPQENFLNSKIEAGEMIWRKH